MEPCRRVSMPDALEKEYRVLVHEFLSRFDDDEELPDDVDNDINLYLKENASVKLTRWLDRFVW